MDSVVSRPRAHINRKFGFLYRSIFSELKPSTQAMQAMIIWIALVIFYVWPICGLPLPQTPQPQSREQQKNAFGSPLNTHDLGIGLNGAGIGILGTGIPSLFVMRRMRVENDRLQNQLESTQELNTILANRRVQPGVQRFSSDGRQTWDVPASLTEDEEMMFCLYEELGVADRVSQKKISRVECERDKRESK